MSTLFSSLTSSKKSHLKWINIAFLIVALSSSYSFIAKNFSETKVNLWSDSEGYYMYQPAWFIYDGWSHIPTQTRSQIDRDRSTRNILNKYTSGVALMQTPFFLLVHAHTSIMKPFMADGYSAPYQLIPAYAALFYVLLGIYFIYQFLRYRGYNKNVVIFSLLTLFFGSNLMHYTLHAPGMSHAYSFFLISIWLYLSQKYHSNSSIKLLLWLSVILGFIILIRPTNIIALLLFFCFKSHSFHQFKSDITPSLKKIIQLSILTIGPILIFFFQLIQWKNMNGQWILFSYNNEAGFIHWFDPKMLRVLFDIQNGLFIYSPILIFAFLGWYKGIKQNKEGFITIGIVFMLLTYIFGSWWAWWFGGAYGHRSYVEYMPMFAIPLTYYYNKKIDTRLWYLILLFTSLIIFYSVGLTLIYHGPWDGSGWTFASFLIKVKTVFFLN